MQWNTSHTWSSTQVTHTSVTPLLINFSDETSSHHATIHESLEAEKRPPKSMKRCFLEAQASRELMVKKFNWYENRI